MRALFSIPLTLVPLLVYAVLATGPAGLAALDGVLFSQAMLSGGTVIVTQGHAVVAIAIATLFLEVVKATRTGFAPVLDHVLSVLTAMAALVAFIVWPPAGKRVVCAFGACCAYRRSGWLLDQPECRPPGCRDLTRRVLLRRHSIACAWPDPENRPHFSGPCVSPAGMSRSHPAGPSKATFHRLRMA